jgi:hypothetical protein
VEEEKRNRLPPRAAAPTTSVAPLQRRSKSLAPPNARASLVISHKWCLLFGNAM